MCEYFNKFEPFLENLLSKQIIKNEKYQKNYCKNVYEDEPKLSKIFEIVQKYVF